MALLLDLKKVYLNNDLEYEVELETKDNQSGDKVPATGMTGLSYWLSRTQNGADIGGTEVALQERSGKPGTYYGVLDATLVNAALSTRVGQRVYGVLSKDEDVNTFAVYVVQRYRRAA